MVGTAVFVTVGVGLGTAVSVATGVLLGAMVADGAGVSVGTAVGAGPLVGVVSGSVGNVWATAVGCAGADGVLHATSSKISRRRSGNNVARGVFLFFTIGKCTTVWRMMTVMAAT